jgi:hypothetical protein
MKLGFKEAAKQILRESDRPLSAADIIRIGLDRGLITTEGKTPSATMGALLYLDIRDNPKSEFIKVKAGLFSLRNHKDSSDGEEYVARHNQKIRESLLKHLHEIDPKEFEYLIAALMDKIGFENVEVVGGTGDGGVDLIGDLTVGGITNVKTVIQAKRHTNNIGSKVIRELRGSAELTKRGLIITTADFSKDAIEESDQPNKMPISLVNGERFVELLVEHEVGIRKTKVEILTVDDDFLGNVGSEKFATRSTDGRSLSIWPLPGGTDQYFTTLLKYLEYVKSNTPSQDDAVKWFMRTYKTVESAKTAKGYTGVPRSMGLVSNDQGHFKLTELGVGLLNDPSHRRLVDVLEQTIIGVSEILEAIEKGPLTEKEIWTYLNESLSLGWKTSAQPRFRLTWLQNAHAVEKLENGTFRIMKT